MIGIPQSTIFRLVSGGEPTLPTLKVIAEKTGRSLHWLATGEAEDQRDLVRIPLRPVFASAGPGVENFMEEPVEMILFSQAFAEQWMRPSGRIEAIRVLGDSMEPTIQNGAIVLIDKSETEPREGRIYALWTDWGLKLKRFQRAIDGSILLVSDNRELYAPERLSTAGMEQLRIAGRAFWTGKMV